MSIKSLSMALALFALTVQGEYEDFTYPRKRRSVKPLPSPKTFSEELEAKGLKKFVINGHEIIAHNENEANKRYRHTYENHH